MPSDARDRIIRVTDLIDRPGASRRVDLVVPPAEDLDFEVAEIDGDIRFFGVIESVVDGLLVRGTVSADLRVSCARCLQDLVRNVSAEVTELFSDPARADSPEDVEAGYELGEDTIDLDTLIRDALVPAVPYRPLCDEDCKGLCAQCGKNHNEEDCDCVDVTVDARWAALEGLRLSDSDN
ncbi:MAG TPA: DUF177 domain-containing protein [Egibacteraceae bacterium]|nr:DUF177 domain-containing protein [Egibacteraceae bacterium]